MCDCLLASTLVLHATLQTSELQIHFITDRTCGVKKYALGTNKGNFCGSWPVTLPQLLHSLLGSWRSTRIPHGSGKPVTLQLNTELALLTLSYLHAAWLQVAASSKLKPFPWRLLV